MPDPIFVSTASELRIAYLEMSATPGGGELLLTAEFEGDAIDLMGGGPEPVTIRSADPENPVSVSQIALENTDNVRVTDLEVNSVGSDRAGWETDLYVINSIGIEIENVVFSSDANGFLDTSNPDIEVGENLGWIRDSDDVSFSNNTVTGYFQGLTIFESTQIEVSGNEFTEIQGDGLRMAGVEDVLVADNHMHGFYGSVQTSNHSDFIQLWSQNAEIVSSNITISGNILNADSGQGYQGIFINNEALSQGQSDYIYTDITIVDNLIHTSSRHGISVYGADGVEISDNTVLWNPEATMTSALGATPVARVPAINVFDTTNATVTGNISPLYSSSNAEEEGNFRIDYDDQGSPDYVGTNFVNALIGNGAELTDLALRADSDWVGLGSDISAPITESSEGALAIVSTATAPVDRETLIFDAAFSVDEAGFVDPDLHTFLWHFPDGTVREGVQVAHDFETHGDYEVRLEILSEGEVVASSVLDVTVESGTFLSLDFQTGVEDASAYGTELYVSDAPEVLSYAGGGNESEIGYRIGGEDAWIKATRENDHYDNLEAFGMSIDIAIDADSAGRFIHYQGVMSARVDDAGQVSLVLRTDEGLFTVDSGDVSIHDGEFHTIAFGYSDLSGTLVMSIDGEVVGQVDAFGTTAQQGSHPLIIGSNWETAPDAVIDNFYFGLNPADAGVTIEGAGIDHDLLEGTLYDPSLEFGPLPKVDAENGPLVLPESALGLAPEPEVAPAATPDGVPEPAAETAPEVAPAATPDGVPEPAAETAPTVAPAATPGGVPEPVAETAPEVAPAATPDGVPEPAAETAPTVAPAATPGGVPEPVAETEARLGAVELIMDVISLNKGGVFASPQASANVFMDDISSGKGGVFAASQPPANVFMDDIPEPHQDGVQGMAVAAPSTSEVTLLETLFLSEDQAMSFDAAYGALQEDEDDPDAWAA